MGGLVMQKYKSRIPTLWKVLKDFLLQLLIRDATGVLQLQMQVLFISGWRLLTLEI